MLVTRTFLVSSLLICMLMLWSQPQNVCAQAEAPVLVRSLQYRTANDSTRIVIKMDGDVEYRGERISNPERIFFDISGAALSPDFGNRNVAVDNKVLKRIRVAQNRQDVVRVVFDVSEASKYSVSQLQNPNRMVIDLNGPFGAETEPDSNGKPPERDAAGAESAKLSRIEADSEFEPAQVVDSKGHESNRAGILKSLSASTQNGSALIRSLQYRTAHNSTKIVLEVDGDVEYRGERISNPDRIFFDISGAKLSPGFGNRNISVDNEILKRIRVAQNRQDAVRVVFDVSEVSEYSVSQLQNPNRVVIDLNGSLDRVSGLDPQAADIRLEKVKAVPDSERESIKDEAPVAEPAVSNGPGTETAVLSRIEADSEAAPIQVIESKRHDSNPSGMLGSTSKSPRHGPALILGLQYRTANGSTQIVLEVDGDVEYRGERIGNPDRIFFDISGAKLGPGFENRNVSVDNEVLKRIRVAQNRQDVVRVVFDVSEVSEYSVSQLQNPNRMVIDLKRPLNPASTMDQSAADIRPEDGEAEPDSKRKSITEEVAGAELAISSRPRPDSAVSSGPGTESAVLSRIEADPEVAPVQVIDYKRHDSNPSGMLESASKSPRNGPALVRSLRYRTLNDSTQIVLEVDGDVKYRGERIGNPDRIFFDISGAKLSPGFGNRNVSVDNEILKRIRVAQNRQDVVRVVFDVSEVSEFSVSQLQNPNRMVIDLNEPLEPVSTMDQSAADIRPEDGEAEPDLERESIKEEAAAAESVESSQPEVESTAFSRIEANPIAKPAQIANLEPESAPASVTGAKESPPEGTRQTLSVRPPDPKSSQTNVKNKVVNLPPKPVSRSIVQNNGLSFMQTKPFTVSGVLTTGYYSSFTRGGSNEPQTIHYIPAGADFNINGYFLTPDLVNYSFQPELNASPQASDAGFQGGNGIRMRINTLRKQVIPLTFRYTNVHLENVYFGSLSQLSSYTLNNRARELGMTSQFRLAGLPTATMDWGTNSVLSQSLIPEIPEYVSKSDHRNIDLNYQKWGWDFRGFAGRQRQTSNLYTPDGETGASSILHQKLRQYRGSVRWNALRDLELSLDAGTQSTSNLLLDRPISLTSRFGNANLRLFQRRRWKLSLRAGYTSNISDLLLTGLIGDLSGNGAIAPDESVLVPLMRTTSSLNIGGFTSVDLFQGLSAYASVDRTEISPAGSRELRSRYLTTTGGMAFSRIFNWGSLSGQYGRSYGNGSVTGQRGRIDGQNYSVTVQPGRWEALQLDFSLRGNDQRIVNELPLHNRSFAFDGNVRFRLFGPLRTRVGGGWQKSDLKNADLSFMTEGYTARAGIEHPRFQITGSLNSILGNPLRAYEQTLSEIGIGSTLLPPIRFTPSNLRGITLSFYAVPIRMLELSTIYTRSIQNLEGLFGNDFETIDASAKFHFRNLKFEAGYFRSEQIYSDTQTINPQTERGRFYFKVSRSFSF